MAEKAIEKQKPSTKKEVKKFLEQLDKDVVESSNNSLHIMLALDHLLTMENVEKLFDKDLKQRARDLWVKIKSTGLQINDPPFLFGVPKEEIEHEQKKVKVEEEHVVVIDMSRLEEKEKEEKEKKSQGKGKKKKSS